MKGPVLTLYYDFECSPPTWNFFDALLRAELHRLQEGYQRIRVRLVPGTNEGFRPDNLPPYGGKERHRWAANICIPMPTLLPSCGEPAEWIARQDAFKCRDPQIGLGTNLHGFKVNGEAALRGIYPFRADPARVAEARAQFGRFVTITMRETGWWASRQSRHERWIPIAEALRQRGYMPLFVRDARHPGMPINGWPTAPAVYSERSDARAALYAAADMNLGIANGPLWFAIFMGAPVLICNLIHADEPAANVHSYAWGNLTPGGQWPTMGPRQRLHWGVDEPEAVLRSFDETMRLEEAA